jgi:parallel beta-helix repeat protein
MTSCPRLRTLGSLLLGLSLALVLPADVRGDAGLHQREVTVRCDKGQTIGRVLANRPGRLTISVVGTCDEHVVVDRDDVSLVAGGPGAGIHGPDATRDTVLVSGHRFRLDGLSVTGGRNAVEISGASRATIQNCVTRGSGGGTIGGIGIRLVDGASGSVDNCDSSENSNDGLMLDASSATITNCTFTGNRRVGILVFNGSNARIGITGGFIAGPNTITGNASNGVHVTIGSSAVIAASAISGNGASPTGAFGRFGVFAFHSRINLPGGNLIGGNLGAGVGLNAATAVIGDPGFTLPTTNVIRGNSTAAPSQGITATLGSALQIRNATVENNSGTGIGLSGRSTVRMFSTTVTGHAANGVQLSQGSAATFEAAAPLSSLTGNAPFDLRCLDAESSIAGPLAAGAVVDCTGF